MDQYGTGAATQRNTARDVGLDVPAPPIEPVSAINQNTIQILAESNMALSGLLAKVRGNQPDSSNAKLEKVPERHVLADARALRDLAGCIFEKTQELHRYIGHDGK